MLRMDGPLLIASNHPNSFLDAIILATLFKKPIYSLARGDAFAGKIITKILSSFNMLPVYRITEGVRNIENNYTTFEACHDIFAKGGIVLIFSEGGCVNEWHLRPLKKGTARLAVTAWQQGVPLTVLPLGINYSSFRRLGKTVILNFGTLINRDEVGADLSSAKQTNLFTETLRNQLTELVYEIDESDQEELENYFCPPSSSLKRIILSIPASAGYVCHYPLIYFIHRNIKKRAGDHYDAVMTGLLFFLYPLYVLILSVVAFFLTKNWNSFLLLLLLPLTALSFLHSKRI